VVRGASLDAALTAAAATGAVACESPNANTVPHWSRIRARIDAGWARRVADHA
jgi:sugar/nucleoside kinase (ribokinase family)